MATITRPELSVSTNLFHNRATLAASCVVAFTEPEVTAINQFGAWYRVECQILNKDIRFEDTVYRFEEHLIPRLARSASANELVEFRADAAMSDLHEHIMTPDQLVAQFTLTDHETGAQDSKRSDDVLVSLGG